MPIEGICSGFSLPGWRSAALPHCSVTKIFPAPSLSSPRGSLWPLPPVTLAALPRTARLQHPLIAPDVAAGAVKLPLGLLFARLNKPSSLSPPQPLPAGLGLPLLDPVQFPNSFKPRIQTFLTPSRYNYSNAEQKGTVPSPFPWSTNQPCSLFLMSVRKSGNRHPAPWESGLTFPVWDSELVHEP